jgi:hypothetical protein
LEEFLLDEEERMTKASKNRSTITTKNAGDADDENINADSGISGQLLQLLLVLVLVLFFLFHISILLLLLLLLLRSSLI